MRVVLIIAFGMLWGCQAAPTATQLRIEPGKYAVAFDAAREVLREYNFTLNRVDGRAGVISTYTKPSAGLASPWDGEQSTPGQEVDDYMNDNQRRVRVTFEPVGPGGGGAGDAVDVRTAAERGETVMRVHATVERIQRPQWRPDTSGVNQYTRALDVDLARRGMEPSYAVPVSEDRLLGARLVEEIRRRMSEPEANRAR